MQNQLDSALEVANEATGGREALQEAKQAPEHQAAQLPVQVLAVTISICSQALQVPQVSRGWESSALHKHMGWMVLMTQVG